MPSISAEFESLGSVLWAILGAGMLFAAARGVGQFLIGPAAGSRLLRWDQSLVQLAAGITAVGWLAIVLGSAKLLGGGRAIWLLGGLALANFWPTWGTATGNSPADGHLANEGRARPARRNRFRDKPPHVNEANQIKRTLPRWIKFAALALIGLTLGPALCYPTGWDELVYHHELPRRWHAHGWPAVYWDLPYSGFPALGELLFWLVTPLDGVIAPRLIAWCCWVLSMAMVYRVLRRRLRSASAAVLTLSLALSNAALLVAANCYVEPLLMMNWAALLLVLGNRRMVRSPGRQALVVGVLAGGAAAVKLTGLAVAIAAGLWQLGGRRPRHSLIIVFTAALFALPFYLRPWLLTGDPFYPYYAAWFSVDPARLEMSRFHQELGAAFGLGGVASFFQGPVFLAFRENIYDGTFGWQLLILLVLAALAARAVLVRARRPLVIGPAVAAAWLYAFWFFTAQQARFAIPAVMALLPLAAIGLRRLRGRARQRVLLLVVCAALWSAPWRNAGYYFGSWMTALGVISRTAYVNEMSDPDKFYAPLMRAIGQTTPADARVMLLFEHRGFYVPRPHVIGTPFFQEQGFTPPENFTSPEQVMDVLARARITHVVMPKKAAGPDQLPDWINRTDPFIAAFYQCVLGDQLVPIWQSPRYAIFEVRR